MQMTTVVTTIITTERPSARSVMPSGGAHPPSSCGTSPAKARRVRASSAVVYDQAVEQFARRAQFM
jgi:hypothetical protein